MRKNYGTTELEDKKAREVILRKAEFEMVDGTLYHVEPDKTLHIVVSLKSRRKYFESAHGGIFGGHLDSTKVYGQLCKHYWWPGMRQNIDSDLVTLL